MNDDTRYAVFLGPHGSDSADTVCSPLQLTMDEAPTYEFGRMLIISRLRQLSDWHPVDPWRYPEEDEHPTSSERWRPIEVVRGFRLKDGIKVLVDEFKMTRKEAENFFAALTYTDDLFQMLN